MDAMKSEMMKRVGPGGFKCSCCNDAFNHSNHPNSRVEKAKARRNARHRIKNEFKKTILNGDI